MKITTKHIKTAIVSLGTLSILSMAAETLAHQLPIQLRVIAGGAPGDACVDECQTLQNDPAGCVNSAPTTSTWVRTAKLVWTTTSPQNVPGPVTTTVTVAPAIQDACAPKCDVAVNKYCQEDARTRENGEPDTCSQTVHQDCEGKIAPAVAPAAAAVWTTKAVISLTHVKVKKVTTWTRIETQTAAGTCGPLGNQAPNATCLKQYICLP